MVVVVVVEKLLMSVFLRWVVSLRSHNSQVSQRVEVQFGASLSSEFRLVSMEYRGGSG